jgi:hypothetical protein
MPDTCPSERQLGSASVDDEKPNPVIRMLLTWERLGDPDFLDNEYPSLIADNFHREDRRRLITLPPTRSTDTIDAVREWHDMAPGSARFSVEEVIAHRGRRLGLSRNRIHVEDDFTELLSLVQLDACDLIESVVWFDVDDREQALHELDSRHGDLGE